MLVVLVMYNNDDLILAFHTPQTWNNPTLNLSHYHKFNAAFSEIILRPLPFSL